MIKYSQLFVRKRAWCFATAICEFIVFFLLFLGVSFLSTLLRINEVDSKLNFISKYQKYIVLASSLYMIVPFAFANILLIGLLQRSRPVLKAYLFGTITNCAVLLLVLIGSGIFLAIDGTSYVGYSLIVLGLLLEALLLHSIFLVQGTKENFQSRSGSTSSTIDTDT